MAAGSAFTLTPNQVVELEPIYNNVITESESMKKEFLNLSATALQRYKLSFKALTTANKDVLIAHYKDQSGGYYPFSWSSVPSYIESGTSITGRWVDGSLSISPAGTSRWSATIIIEKST